MMDIHVDNPDVDIMDMAFALWTMLRLNNLQPKTLNNLQTKTLNYLQLYYNNELFIILYKYVPCIYILLNLIYICIISILKFLQCYIIIINILILLEYTCRYMYGTNTNCAILTISNMICNDSIHVIVTAIVGNFTITTYVYLYKNICLGLPKTFEHRHLRTLTTVHFFIYHQYLKKIKPLLYYYLSYYHMQIYICDPHYNYCTQLLHVVYVEIIIIVDYNGIYSSMIHAFLTVTMPYICTCTCTTTCCPFIFRNEMESIRHKLYDDRILHLNYNFKYLRKTSVATDLYLISTGNNNLYFYFSALKRLTIIYCSPNQNRINRFDNG